MPDNQQPQDRFHAYRHRLRLAMAVKLKHAQARSHSGEVRGLARTIGLNNDAYDLQASNLHNRPKEALIGGMFSANPIVFNALGVTLIVGTATSLQKSLIISAVALVLLVVVNLLTALLYNRLSDLLRLPAYALTAALLLIPIGRFLVYYYPSAAASLGIYLPLTGVCGLVIVRAESYATGSSVPFALADAVGNGLGFGIICVLIGALRELIGSGKIGGFTLIPNYSFPAAYLSFFPFLLLGIISAAWQTVRLRRTRRVDEGAEETVGEAPDGAQGGQPT